MKRLVLGLVVLAVGGCARAASTDTVEQKVVEIHMTRNTRIVSDEKVKHKTKARVTIPLPSYGTCSGAFVDGVGDIITAKHCVDGFDSWEVVTLGQQHFTAVVIATSSTHDLAMLHIDKRDTPFFHVARTTKRGEKISVLGSPLGITDTLSEGVVAKLDGDMILLDCGALPGNSGGPVYNADQELVGILIAGYVVMQGTTHLNVAQSADVILFFISEAWEKRYRSN